MKKFFKKLKLVKPYKLILLCLHMVVVVFITSILSSSLAYTSLEGIEYELCGVLVDAQLLWVFTGFAWVSCLLTALAVLIGVMLFNSCQEDIKKYESNGQREEDSKKD